MSLTSSTMMPLGTKAPAFLLSDTVSGRQLSLDALKSGVATVVMFICNHCPYVKHVQLELVRLASHYQAKGVVFVAISSNDAAGYPQDAPDQMKVVAQRLGYPFAYLYDDTQEVAKAYGAVCTPDFFVFDGDLKCVYRGRLDDSSPGNGRPLNGADLRAALDAVRERRPVSADQKPSQGCNIKFRR